MKYVLVDNFDNVVDKKDLSDEIGVSGARTYFRGIKRLKQKQFEELWKVMTSDEYDRQFHSTNRPPSYQGIKWWEEDKDITDSELKY